MRDNRSCFVDSDSSRRLLLVEFKGTVFLFTTLHTHVKVSSINFSKVKLSAKYVLPAGPLSCSRMLLAHSAFLLKCTCVQGNHFRLKKLYDNRGFCFIDEVFIWQNSQTTYRDLGNRASRPTLSYKHIHKGLRGNARSRK